MCAVQNRSLYYCSTFARADSDMKSVDARCCCPDATLRHNVIRQSCSLQNTGFLSHRQHDFVQVGAKTVIGIDWIRRCKAVFLTAMPLSGFARKGGYVSRRVADFENSACVYCSFCLLFVFVISFAMERLICDACCSISGRICPKGVAARQELCQEIV